MRSTLGEGPSDRPGDVTTAPVSVRTDDPEAFTEQLRLCAPGCRILPFDSERFCGDARLTRLPQATLFRVGLEGGRVLIEEHDAYLGVTVPLSAPVRIYDDGDWRSFAPGSAHVFNRQAPFHLRSPAKSQVLASAVFAPLLERTARKLNGGEGVRAGRPSWRFSLATPLGYSYWRFTSFLWGELQRGAAFLNSASLTRAYEETLATGLLLAADADRQRILPAGHKDCSVAAVRRAEEFLAGKLTEPVSLADVADAAETHVRTLTRAFKKARGTGPMGFLRDLRLQRAHIELLGGDPRRTTVTEVAVKYGFYQLSHFATAYRERFQENPSDTLRR